MSLAAPPFSVMQSWQAAVEGLLTKWEAETRECIGRRLQRREENGTFR
jgi:hypothetical protein